MGTIGVRCAKSRTSLWFHLDAQFATEHLNPDFRTDGLDRAANEALGILPPWDQLTKLGLLIVSRVLTIRGVVRLSARPNYLDLQVRREEDWRCVLPQVVRIIREETRDPYATVRTHQTRGNERYEDWHAPLLRELFD